MEKSYRRVNLGRALNKNCLWATEWMKSEVCLSQLLQQTPFLSSQYFFSIQGQLWPLLQFSVFKKKEKKKTPCLTEIFLYLLFLLSNWRNWNWRPDKQGWIKPYSPHNRNIHIFSNIFGFIYPWKTEKAMPTSSWELALEYQAFSLFLLESLEIVDLTLPVSQPRSWM